MSKKSQIVILGAGMAGMAAAHALKRQGIQFTLLEKDSTPGGLAKGFEKHGCLFDIGPHYFFSTLAQKTNFLDHCLKGPHKEEIYVNRRFYGFPFGLIKKPTIITSVAGAYLKRQKKQNFQNLEELLHVCYGKGFSKTILCPLFEKWTQTSAEELSAEYGERLLPPTIGYLIYSIFKKRSDIAIDYYEGKRYFVYPEKGMKEMINHISAPLKNSIILNSKVTDIKIDSDMVVSLTVETQTEKINIEQPKAVISTIPLPELNNLCKHEKLKKYAELRYRPIRIVYLFVNKDRVMNRQWAWFPEAQFPFYRISENKTYNAALAPAGKTVLCVEMSCSINSDIWETPLSLIAEKIIKDISKIYNIKRNDIFDFFDLKLKYAYPLLLASQDAIRKELKGSKILKNLFTIGRNGKHAHLLMEDAWNDGEKILSKLI